MAKQDSRGAKIYLISEENFAGHGYPPYEYFVRELIDWTDSTKPFERIANIGGWFEKNLAHGEASRLCGKSTLNTHCSDGEFTQKSLATIICFIFFEHDDQLVIQEKLEKLFNAIRCTEGSSYFKWINKIIEENIAIKISSDDKREKSFNAVSGNDATADHFRRKYDKDWKFSITKDWQTTSSKRLKKKKKIVGDRFLRIPEIVSVLNNERELNGKRRSWWERHKSLFAYIVSMLLGWTWLGMSVIAIGFYKTRKQVVDRRVKRIRYVIFSFAIFITAGVITWGILRNQTLTQGLIQNAEITLPAQFDGDPYRNGFGFATISDSSHPDPNSGECEYIEVPELKPGEEYPVKLFIRYSNIGRLLMIESRAQVFYTEVQIDSSAVFTAHLISSNSKDVFDTASILNMKFYYNIYFDRGLHWNRNGKFDPTNCSGFDLVREVENHIFTQNAYTIGDLENSHCSSGTIRLDFIIRNDLFLFHPEEKGIFMYKNRIRSRKLSN